MGRSKTALEQLAAEMAPGSFVGLHPEGRRSTGDPYTLLPPKPGLGILIQACHPDTMIVPYFTLGLSNSLAEVIHLNRKPAGQRGPVVSLRFGEPLRAGDMADDCTPLEATERVMVRIRELGDRDRDMRAHIGPA